MAKVNKGIFERACLLARLSNAREGAQLLFEIAAADSDAGAEEVLRQFASDNFPTGDGDGEVSYLNLIAHLIAGAKCEDLLPAFPKIFGGDFRERERERERER